ncbi:Vacuolar protein 8 [Mactra antiquata]
MDGKLKEGETSSAMEQFEIKIERPKPNPVDEVINLLKRILDCCLYCLTCGCYQGNSSSRRSSTFNDDSSYSSILLDNERQAIQNLLRYLEDEETKNPVLDENHIKALSILTYSDNTDLQRSAALCYSEISEKMKVPINNPLSNPLVALLKSPDIEVLKATTLAISNFVVNGPAINRLILVDSGALQLLIPLLYHDEIEVQCNACGCITTLATTDITKRIIAEQNGIPGLLQLIQSTDLRVQRNAAGSLLNLTHIQENRNDLVLDGAIPIFIQTLQSTTDHDMLYYCCAALSNLAINEKHRAMMVAVGCHDVLDIMIRLLMSKSERVKCQACYVLRNLASDGDNQCLIVQYKGLTAIHRCIRHSKKETKSAALACLRNLSIHKANEGPLLSPEILGDIFNILTDSSIPEAQRHAAGVIRNLSVGDHIRELTDQGCVEKLGQVILDIETRANVLAEVTAAIAVMADDDLVKHQLMMMHDGKVFVKLVTMATLSLNTEVQYNSAGILGQLALIAIPTQLKTDNIQGIVLYIDKFLKSEDSNFNHIALWTLVQMLKDALFLQAFRDQGVEHIVTKLTHVEHPSTVQELASKVLLRLQGDLESSPTSSE